jgi:hypothetical protein
LGCRGLQFWKVINDRASRTHLWPPLSGSAQAAYIFVFLSETLTHIIQVRCELLGGNGSALVAKSQCRSSASVVLTISVGLPSPNRKENTASGSSWTIF